MADMSAYIRCQYCRTVAKKKYHNTVYPYCGNCNRDLDGIMVYICGSCGLDTLEHDMVDVALCDSCWHRDTDDDRQDASAEIPIVALSAVSRFVAGVQKEVPALQGAAVGYRRMDEIMQGIGFVPLVPESEAANLMTTDQLISLVKDLNRHVSDEIDEDEEEETDDEFDGEAGDGLWY
jgi:hypothetical protein